MLTQKKITNRIRLNGGSNMNSMTRTQLVTWILVAQIKVLIVNMYEKMMTVKLCS